MTAPTGLGHHAAHREHVPEMQRKRGVGLGIRQRAIGDHRAVIQKDKPLAEFSGQVQIVAGHRDRDALVAVQALDNLHDFQ